MKSRPTPFRVAQLAACSYMIMRGFPIEVTRLCEGWIRFATPESSVDVQEKVFEDMDWPVMFKSFQQLDVAKTVLNN